MAASDRAESFGALVSVREEARGHHKKPDAPPVTWGVIELLIDLLEAVMADADQTQQDVQDLQAAEAARDEAQTAQNEAVTQAVADLRDEVNNLTAQLPNPEQANALHAALTAVEEKIKEGTAAEQSEQASAQAADPGAQQAPGGGGEQPAPGEGDQPAPAEEGGGGQPTT
jgi:hypothetical protein